MKHPQDETPKLRMAPPETPEELAHRVEREQRAEQLQREGDLEDSLKPFRVGSVGYLNAAPLVRGIENELVIATPARLAEMLQKDELDAGLVSLTEVLFNDRYDVLDGIAIASLGEVQSVLLGHRQSLEQTNEGDFLRCGLADEREPAACVAGGTGIEGGVQTAARWITSRPRSWMRCC